MTDALLDARLKKIKLLAMDLDGVLTNGTIYFGDHGDEIKGFHIQDGQGIALALRVKMRVAIITGRKSRVNERRARELRVDRLIQDCHDKGRALEKLVQKYRIGLDEAAYVGDDLLDLAPMRKAGLAVAVRNAVAEVKSAAHFVTEKAGGEGAVREIVDLILKAQGHWNGLVGKAGSG